MAHNFLEPGCTVYVWLPKGRMKGLWGSYWETPGTRVGHAAIKVSDGTGAFIYLSFWPAEKPEDLPSAPSLNRQRGIDNINKVLTTGGLDPMIFGKTMGEILVSAHTDGDSDHEHGKPDEKFRFTQGLNWKNMLDTATRIRTECKTYHFLKNNCSHAVARVLDSGSPPLKVPLTGYVHNVWQPSDVSSYCRKLITALNKTHASSAKEKKAGMWV
jgi:hypothetical protein